MSLLTPTPARHIDPRGMRFGAGVSAIVLRGRVPPEPPVAGRRWSASTSRSRRSSAPACSCRAGLAVRQARAAPRSRRSPSTSTRRGSRRRWARRSSAWPGSRSSSACTPLGWLLVGRGRRAPDAARRDRDLRRLPAVLPALVGPVAVREAVPADRLAAPAGGPGARPRGLGARSVVERVEQPRAVGDDRRLGAVGRAELPDDVLDVLLDGVLGDRELARRSPCWSCPPRAGGARRARAA